MDWEPPLVVSPLAFRTASSCRLSPASPVSELRASISQDADAQSRHSPVARRALGLSEEAVRHNSHLQRSFRVIDNACPTYHRGGNPLAPRALHCPNNSPAALHEGAEAVDGAQNHHRRTVALLVQAAAAEDPTSGDKVENQKNRLCPRRIAQPSSAMVFLDMGACNAFNSSGDESPQACRTTRKILTKAQVHAMSKFEEIDAGRADLTEVLEDISDNNRRVMAKLEFYRDRSDLVLPRIEEQFMNVDERTGAPVVDIVKVRNARWRKQRSGSSSARETHSEPPVQLPRLPLTAREHVSVPQLASATSRCSMSPSPSAESVFQRAERLCERRQLKDCHIEAVRETRRERIQARRHAVFDGLERKNLRKEIATRDKTLLTWIVLAMATSTMAQSWKSFVDIFKKVKETAMEEEKSLVRRGSECIPHLHLKDGSFEVFSQSCTQGLVLHAREMVLQTINKSWDSQVKVMCQRHAYKLWCHTLRVFRFIAILKRRIRMNILAEMIKDVINSHWRGYHMRAGLKVFIGHVKTIQTGIRAYVELRSHIRNFILLPMLWEIETGILGAVMGMPQSELDHELEVHHAVWNPKQHLAEARRMIDLRDSWHNPSKSEPGQHAVRITAPSNHGTSEGAATHVAHHRARRGTRKMSILNGKQGKFSHPMMEVIEKYRLSKDLRDKLAKRILKENTDRWYTKYLEYKEQCAHLAESWEQWYREIGALGPAYRAAWPPPPPFPMYPYELVKIDPKAMRGKVLMALKQTEAGKLL